MGGGGPGGKGGDPGGPVGRGEAVGKGERAWLGGGKKGLEAGGEKGVEKEEDGPPGVAKDDVHLLFSKRLDEDV